jgi:hypothetical protein
MKDGMTYEQAHNKAREHYSAEHTPTPWTFDGCGINGSDPYASRLFTGNGYKQVDGDQQKQADGEFIVRAVNGFEALEAQNAQLRETQEDITYLLANALEHWTSNRAKAKRYVEAAIAKAESNDKGGTR